MPALSVDHSTALREVAEVENALRDGYAPPGETLIGSHRKSALRVAADRLGSDPQSVRGRIGTPEHPGFACIKFGLSVDWSMYREPPPVPEPLPSEAELPAPPSDPVDLRRLKDENARLRAALADAERRAADAEDIRGRVLGLTSEPLRPVAGIAAREPSGGRQAVILHLSDLHAGEVISAPEILGSNSYNLDIFRARISRLFATAADLSSKHWPRGDPLPTEIIVCLGGDLISGSIHQELSETNEGTDYEIFRECAERIAGGIELIRAKTKLPVRCYSVPGNHGRQTLKPQSKRQGLQSWDILVSDFAEAALRYDKGVTWYRSEGTDCYFDVLGWPVILTHGHTMGSSGGQGFIGPMAPIVRGHQKISHTEYRQRRPVYLVLSGHFHTTGKTPWGWGNGSLVGYSEYARGFRGEPEPAQQNFHVIHEKRGLIRWHPIYVGDASEGSLYEGFGRWLAPAA